MEAYTGTVSAGTPKALARAWLWIGIALGAKSALIASFVLFGTGGVLGYMIHGTNVVIPAHYHGTIVGVTLAFMGLGGHIAIIGGLMFVLVCLKAMAPRRRAA